MDAGKTTADASDAIKGLEKLENKIGKKLVRKALRTAAKPTLALAKSTAPEQSGRLKRSVKIRSGGTRKGVTWMRVGVGKKWFVGPMFYAAFVAFGHPSREASARHRSQGRPTE